MNARSRAPRAPKRPASTARAPARNSAHRAFDLLGVTPSLARLLRYFVLRPQARPHLRKLQRDLGLGSASIQRDLARLTAAGILRSAWGSGRTVSYSAVPGPFWELARKLVAASDDPAQILAAALRDVAGIEAAFLFGSHASGTAQPDSDVDVLVVGDAVDRRGLHRQLFEVGQTLGRQVNALCYTRQMLAERLASGAGFAREVLERPTIPVAGDPRAVAPIAVAAGLLFPVNGPRASRA